MEILAVTIMVAMILVAISVDDNISLTANSALLLFFFASIGAIMLLYSLAIKLS